MGADERHEPTVDMPRPSEVIVSIRDAFAAAWEEGEVPLIEDHLSRLASADAADSRKLLIDLIETDIERRWKRARRLEAKGAPLTDFPGGLSLQPLLDEYAKKFPVLGPVEELPLELIGQEYRTRRSSGQSPPLIECFERFRDRWSEVQTLIEEIDAESVNRDTDGGNGAPGDKETANGNGDDGNGGFTLEDDEPPKNFGRYEVVEKIKTGGFAHVLRGKDPELQRDVAIKVPRRDKLRTKKHLETYITEARRIAGLRRHHGIVSVLDVGRIDDGEIGSCYVVSDFIEGGDLAGLIKREPPTPRQAAELVRSVAEALEHTHRHGLIHRDVKPANILIDWVIDRDGTPLAKPLLIDFGIALTDDDVKTPGNITGTLEYLSPEQARGEEHLLTGQSDIFSLGIVFYELLVKELPFGKDLQALQRIQSPELAPMPPRQINNTIPAELERICLKALAKRASDRYVSASEMAEDLRYFLAGERKPVPKHDAPKVVPKGLRAFDADDSNFFLDLLPGPRDRDGLPDSIRFWKTRIEQTDADETFRVGVIYGPSGCGKSSLVRAGLIPRLAKHVTSVFVEATADNTEAQLLHKLRRACPDLPRESGLKDVEFGLKDLVAALRRGRGITAGHKVLLVLDQFEQWLNANRAEDGGELLQALRQCDGEHVQCVLMIRDDFWMAVSRFMGVLDIPLVERENCAAVDLFDINHARMVLAEFGRAYEQLPENLSGLTKQQNAFLTEAVEELAEDGKVISVRLALFAHMVQSKAWAPETLEKLKGVRGIGVQFLEETFTTSSAPRRQQERQVGARAVLESLLPPHGTNIKGHMRSRDELLSAYRNADAKAKSGFDDLLRLLNQELRLITPTDPAGGDLAETEPGNAAGQQYYQLTHDYLVPSLRDWLTFEDQKTAPGRARLKLQERSDLWNAKPENARLPSLFEYLNVRRYISPGKWTVPQRAMMTRAGRVYAVRAALALVVLLAVGMVTQQFMAFNDRKRADSLVEAVLTAPGQAVPYALANLEPLEKYAVPLLRQRLADETTDPIQRLHAAMGLAHFGESRADVLVAGIPVAPAGELNNIVAALDHPNGSDTASLREHAEKCDAEGNWALKYRYAIVGLHRGDSSIAEEMCSLRPNPIQRTMFIETFPKWHAVAELVKTPGVIDQPDLRSAVCLGVGSISPEQLDVAARSAWEGLLLNWYKTAPDTGTHSAAGWALRHLGVELPRIDATSQPVQGRQWHVNGGGLTMLRIPAGSLDCKDIDGKPQTLTVRRPFFLSDREVTVGQFQKFMDDAAYRFDKPHGEGVNKNISPTPDHPVQQVSWYDAVMYCNWLSRCAGLTPSYRGSGESWELVTDALGYRLPTEVEWEYACRAGSATEYAFGDDVLLLGRYGVFDSNSFGKSAPCASKLPNGLGLFDMHGNVWEWCQDLSGGGSLRVNRGGGWRYDAGRCRSASRYWIAAGFRYYVSGFRVASVLVDVSGE